ncbi:putative pap2 domain containing protein [Erysiphe necator]|uniref:Putative pap2 domain containing protein n=1 Tax=Uncinula necator TaxID=52586 RepID=A0A0B1PDR1_UNCNE|nr:putative pap2 domain containing protein [Erysiphe necator]
MKNPSAVRGRSGASLKLVLSYVVDWLVVIFGAFFGLFVGSRVPNKRPFSLENPDISFPYKIHEKVSVRWLGLYAFIIPALVIFAICLVLVPGPTVTKSTPRSAIWHRRMWELHVGLLGLSFSLSLTVLITGGMKNLFGKPRPDLLARCIPDMANLERYKVGGYLVTNVVSADICQQTNRFLLNDGFRSYPSGHSSFASGGLIYLSLYLASKLAISIPYLSQSTLTGYNKPQNPKPSIRSNPFVSKQEAASINDQKNFTSCDRQDFWLAARRQAAAPPLYLLIFAAIPFSASIYIASTRYSDFRHHGFDILFGYMIGVLTSIVSFRFYQLPIGHGAGWAWGPRSSYRSFWTGVGIGNYVGSANDGEEEIGLSLHLDGELSDIENGQSTGPSNDRLELLPMQTRFSPIEPDLLPTKNK